MAGSASHVHDPQRRWREVGSQVLVDHMGTNPPAQRPVVAVNEAATECCPRVLGSVSGDDIILPLRGDGTATHQGVR